MNREQIIELAKQADAYADAMDIGGKNYIGLRDEYFAALVAAAEREACIYEIEMHTPRLGHTSDGEIRSKKMIEAIRARGETK